MLVEFSVSNFRSIKEKQTLSLIADKSKAKWDNVFTPMEGDKLRLLKSAVIYGANASGKSNIIKAFLTFLKYIHEVNIDVDQAIPFFKPFLLNPARSQKPTYFQFVFILNGIMYEYDLAFDSLEVISENLYFYPKKRKAKLFEREKNEVTFGNYLENKGVVSKTVKPLKKYPYLSLVARQEYEQILKIYEYSKEYIVFGGNDSNLRKMLEVDITRELLQNEPLRRRLAKLMRIADTNIDNFSIVENNVDFLDNLLEDIPEELQEHIINRTKYEILTSHQTYNDRHPENQVEFNFSEQESMGTQILYALGGLILLVLENRPLIIVDELDNSLHPELSKLLIKLFHIPASNRKNAQIIFATHETTLLDRELFRKDQIYFTEKDKYGATELFSAQDFEGVKDDVPFDTWYLQGKFGGKPNIKEMEFIFGDE